MKFLDKITTFRLYILLSIAFALCLWIINIGGFLGLQSKGVIINNFIALTLYSFINNFFFAIIFGLLFFPIYLLLSKKSEAIALKIIGFILVIVLFIELSLIKYNLITLILLGGDLWGYSFSDITTTASASNEYNLSFLWPFFVLPALVYILFIVIKKTVTEKIIRPLIIILALSVIIIKVSLSEVSAKENQNKFSFLITDSVRVLGERNSSIAFEVDSDKPYPLLQSIEKTNDVLGTFFNENSEKPNIVILIIEGLGRNFTGVDAEYKGFTPFLDSLQQKSLYWKNTVSITGRTFGVIPSILGSLPLGDEGFLEVKETPSHISLITALKELNYTSSFYTGSDSSFDRIINFMEYQGTDLVVDQKSFGEGYTKTETNEGGFSWGYADGELYKKALSVIDKQTKPRLDIYLTVTNHEPFSFPNNTSYLKKVESKIKSGIYSENQKTVIKKSPEIFASLMYVDQSLKEFFKGYQKRADYGNTIFIITGDHRLIPIPQKDNLSRFHVPLIIYSPLLKQSKQFESIASHSDITPSIMAFLHNRFRFESLKETAWLSAGLDTVSSFRGTKEIPLMRYKGAINDFIYKNYFFTDNTLYQIDKDFNLTKIKDSEIEKEVKKSFQYHKSLNHYLVSKNKIYPDSLKLFKVKKFEFTQQQLKKIESQTKDKNADEQFVIARDMAHNGKREEARLICNYILNEFPNHSDVSILKGRILAWDGKYEEAEPEFLKVIKKDPYYDDAYLALLDLYWWSEQEVKSLNLIKKDVLVNITNPEISFKLAKANFRMNNTKRAKVILDSIIKKYPQNQEFKTFRATLK
ncbi:MAG: sulfatase-like hydrolase/transferase [Flavobacteriaceae bacterium]|nr:sulfatase-like hydrolase/transferase [Flavobacteriaceae bacterium]